MEPVSTKAKKARSSFIILGITKELHNYDLKNYFSDVAYENCIFTWKKRKQGQQVRFSPLSPRKKQI